MAEIITAKSAGFCFGVQKAVDTVYSEVEKGRKIYTFGPIIHNDFVVSDLEKKGVIIIDDLDGINDLEKGVVIISRITRAIGIEIIILDRVGNFSSSAIVEEIILMM